MFKCAAIHLFFLQGCPRDSPQKVPPLPLGRKRLRPEVPRLETGHFLDHHDCDLFCQDDHQDDQRPPPPQVADLSHWVNVAETNSSDPDLTAVIERLAPKFHHTHCRFDLEGGGDGDLTRF